MTKLAAMHSWKKIALKSNLEQRLPGCRVDCLLISGWSATIIISPSDQDAFFYTSDISLAKLKSDEDVELLALDLVEEYQHAIGYGQSD